MLRGKESGSGSAGSGTGDSPALAADVPMSKEDKLKAKNRRAQAKYRQRKQGERSRLYRESVEMAAAVRKIEAEKAFLEAQVQALSSELQESQDATSSSHSSEEEPIYTPANGYRDFNPMKKPGLYLKAIFDPPRRFTHKQALALTLRDHLEIRKEIALKAGQLLIKNPEKDPSSAEGQQLKDLICEAHGVVAFLATLNPNLLIQLTRAKAVDPVELEAAHPPGLWEKALKRLELTEEQQDVLLGNYQAMKQKTGRLLTQRLQLQKAAQALEAGIEQFQEGADEFQMRHHKPPGLQWASLARALQENLDDIHVENSKFCIQACSMWTTGEFGSKVGLSVFQDATLMVHAFPYWPSMRSVLTELALQRGLAVEPHLDLLDPDTGAVTGEAEEEDEPVTIPDLSEQPYQPVSAKLLEEYLKWKLTLDSAEDAMLDRERKLLVDLGPDYPVF